jgi:hypothetical protein
MPGMDCIVIVSHLVENVYRGSFHKRIRLDNLDSVVFSYIKKTSRAVLLLYLRHKRMQISPL